MSSSNFSEVRKVHRIGAMAMKARPIRTT